VHNGGSALHNISVTEQNLDIDLEPGKTVTVPIQVATTPVVFFCKYHRSSGMVGSLLPASAGGQLW